MAEGLSELLRDVSASPAEYERGLRQAFPEGVSGGPLHFTVTDGEVGLEIGLTPGPDRVIALVRLPTLMARLRFVSGSDAERRATLARMDLAMRRGGG